MSDSTTVTILFTDVVGSSELRTSRGDASAHQMLEAHDAVIRREIEQYDGREIKTIGDSFMVAFSSAHKAVDCAVSIQRALSEYNQNNPEQQVHVRIGMNAGEVIEKGGDLFGATVDAAARVMSKAAGGQILIPDSTRNTLGDGEDIPLLDRGPFWLKGFPERWRLHEVLWREDKVSTAVVLPHIGHRTPFVGREKERADLRRYMESAQGGHGSLVMIGGEPGVGKTRIAEELAAEADRHGFLTLTGHCYEMEGAPPYIPFIEILQSTARVFDRSALLDVLGSTAPEVAKIIPELRERFPEIPEPRQLAPDQERLYLLNNLRDFFERLGRQRPLVMVFEDLHWADESTMMLLKHIAQQVGETPVLVIGTYRDTELDVARSFAKGLEELLRQRLAHDILLKRLPQADVAAMLQKHSGQEPPARFVGLVYRETEGNPFFVEEILKHFAEEGKLFDARGNWRSDVEIGEADVPRGVRLVIGRRLERMSEESRRMLTSAAVIGRAFGFDLLEVLADLDEDSLFDSIEAAEQAQLITSKTEGGRARFIFSHELIRQTLVSGLSLPRRQRLHLRVAETMERLYANALEQHAADIAHHLLQAGAAADSRKTVRYLKLAGDRAGSSSAFEDTLRFYEDALSLQPSDDPQGRAELIFRRGLALRSLNRWDEALADWREALTIYEKFEDAEAMGHICVEISDHLTHGARLEEAYETASRGLKALGSRVNAARCLLLATAGFVLAYAPGSEYNVIYDMFSQALGMAEELDDGRLLGRILYRKAMFHHNYWQGRDVVAVGMRAEELLRPSGDFFEAAFALAIAQCGLVWGGHLDEAARIQAEAKSLADRAGNDVAHWIADIGHSDREVIATGNINQYEKRLTANLDFGDNAGIGFIAWDYTQFGWVQFWRGRWEEAREKFQKGVDLMAPGKFFGFCVGPLFLFTAYAGDKDAALALHREIRSDFPCAGQANTYGAWAILDTAIEGLAVLGEWDEAARLYPLALEAIATGNLIRASWAGLVQTVAGIAAMAGHQWDKSEEHFKTALHQAREITYKIEQPEVRRWYARMIIERDGPGDKEKASGLLTEAMTMYGEIGMPKHLEMAEELMNKL